MSKKHDDGFWLDKITGSKYFTSVNDVKLFRYLVHSTREGKNLKETIIAIDVFGRDSSFNSGTDSIVRSNIYNLRKKIDSYYLNEGIQDDIRFVIPKGSYRVLIEKNIPKTNVLPQKANMLILKILFPITILLMLVFAFLYFFNNKKSLCEKLYEDNPIWNYYCESEKPLMIVLGDYFMMQKTQFPDSSYNFIRDPEINSQNDFANYLEKNPAQKESLKKLGQSYFGGEIPFCYSQVLQLFKNLDKAIGMRYASDLSVVDIRNNDLIFIGDFGTLGILTPFFSKTGIKYSNIPPAISILNNQKDTIEYISLKNPDQSVFQNDYAIVLSINTHEGNKILFFVSFLPFGKSEALYKMGDTSFLTELNDSASSFPDEWYLIMKISGLQSTGFYYETLRFEEIE